MSFCSKFQEYEKREIARKSRKILAMYDYVSAEEIEEMLLDNDNDEVRIRRYLLAFHAKI
jgi:hypothetical protein